MGKNKKFISKSKVGGKAINRCRYCGSHCLVCRASIISNSEKNVDCLIGSLELAKAASKSQLTKFIGIGACFEYETSNDALTIFTPLNPTTLYGCKSFSYLSLKSSFEKTNIQFCWCRLFYLYGEGNKKTVRIYSNAIGKQSACI